MHFSREAVQMALYQHYTAEILHGVFTHLYFHLWVKPGDFSPPPLCRRCVRCYGALLPSSASFLGSKEPSFAGQSRAAAPQAPLQPPSPAGVVASGVIASAKPPDHSCCSITNIEVLQSSRGLSYQIPKEAPQISSSCKRSVFFPAFGPSLLVRRGDFPEPSLWDRLEMTQARHNSLGKFRRQQEMLWAANSGSNTMQSGSPD